MAAGLIPVSGHLPQLGGVIDQGAWLLDAFDIIDNAYAELTASNE